MVSKLEFSTVDPERAIPVLAEFFPDARMNNPGANFEFELSSAETEPLSLVHLHAVSPSSSSSTDMSGSLSFGKVEGGNLSLASGRHEIDTTLPWLYPQGSVRGEWDELTMTALKVSVPMLLRRARAELGDEHFRLRFVGSSPTDPARARQWMSLVDYLRVAYSEEAMVDSEIVRANAFAHVASMILVTFPNSFIDASQSRQVATTMPTAIRRAIQYMDDNAHLPIAVEDVAEAARLSVRGLQYSFRTSLDTTPTAYLRRVRLAGVHRDLKLGDPTRGMTVGATALAWGFTHPGRFAKQYREAYGSTPRHTLET
jgi:AraC-like DNA-binding protein